MIEEEFADLNKEIPNKSKVPLHKIKKEDVAKGYADHLREILSRGENEQSDVGAFHKQSNRVLSKKLDSD